MIVRKTHKADPSLARQFFTLKLAGEVQVTDVAMMVKEGSKGMTPLDARAPADFAQGHIPGAINVPLADAAERLDEFRQDGEYFTYCYNKT